MKPKKYQGILYFIITVIVITLTLQGYWFYRTYQAEQRELVADLQVILNKTVDDYFTQLAKQESVNFIVNSNFVRGDSLYVHSDQISSDSLNKRYRFLDSLNTGHLKHFVYTDSSNGSSFTAIRLIDSLSSAASSSKQIKDSLKKHLYQLSREPIELLTKKIVISFSEQEMSLAALDAIFRKELNQRKLWVDYNLLYKSDHQKTQSYGDMELSKPTNTLFARSSFLPEHESLQLSFKNTTPLIMHRNGISLLLSLLFVACIIGCLLYLLKIIREQKQLAEIKNDLISNITHEFKTPLATIGVGLEAIQKFNTNNDPEKSKKYAAMSQEQVKKLSGMVEKILETATLDSQSLVLNKEEINLTALCKRLAVLPEAYLSSQKTVSFNAALEDLTIMADAFHIENVINILIDNALKYGGAIISLKITADTRAVKLTVHDNGRSLNKAQSQRIFDKFYRVPTGDTHDVKGFGIGLYYAKNIIEKHGGVIEVNLENGTAFTLIFPYE